MMAALRQLFRRSTRPAQKSPDRRTFRRPHLGVEALTGRVMLSATPLRLAVTSSHLQSAPSFLFSAGFPCAHLPDCR